MSKKAYNYAIYLLSKRDYSIFKMRQKLLSQKFEADEIDATIDKLIDQSYLREEEYKRMRIKTHLLKGYSNRYIIHKLMQEELEVTNVHIETLREEYDLDRTTSLCALIEKKLRGKSIPETFEAKLKLKNKILNFLGAKGYSYDEAKEALSEYI